jgi:hypothetical protein
MAKKDKRPAEECREPLRVEPYGGGVRWGCPRCDHTVIFGGHIPAIQMWNCSPPQDRRCHNLLRWSEHRYSFSIAERRLRSPQE